MLDRSKLAKVLGMVGSSHDGEALVAARRANEMLKSAGLTWEQALGNHEAEVATEACRRLLAERDELLEQLERARARVAWTPDRWVEPDTVAEMVDRCIEFREHLSEWEREFAGNLAGWRRPLTPKQSRRLDELVDKVRRIARARGLAA